MSVNYNGAYISLIERKAPTIKCTHNYFQKKVKNV